MKIDDRALQIWVAALNLARATKQTVGPKNNYYVTVEQLESIMAKTLVAEAGQERCGK